MLKENKYMVDHKSQVRELIGLYREKIWSLVPGPYRTRVGEELKELAVSYTHLDVYKRQPQCRPR